MPEKQNNTTDHSGKKKELGKLKIYKRFKWYHILAAVIVLTVASLFIGWHLVPSRVLNIAVLDKTVLSYSEDDDIVKDTVYRKHQGLFWLMNQQKYVKPDGTDYDYKNDYYGSMLDDEGAPDKEVSLKDIKEKPDLVYLSDAYGLGNDTFGYYNGGTPQNSGISSDDLSVIAYAYGSGAPVIGETTLFSSALSDSVYSQLTSLFGVTPKKWIGRYIVDLEDFTDIPDWAPPMYEQQEGVEWRFTGPGILLVSNDGKIIILEQNTDFSSKDLLKIYINEKYKAEFPDCADCNFYNWFELIDSNYNTESIATFDFDLNAVGMEKIKEISKTPRFCAIARKQEKNHPPVYFFAGDFNDYVNGERYGKFLFANQFFKFLSFDRQGDISNFYWNFYNPLMRHILDKTKTTEYVKSNDKHAEVSRVNEDKFQVLEDKKWKSINLRAVALNPQAPAEKQYSRDIAYYDELIKSAVELGANCIVAKDLLPPEFYTSINRHNSSGSGKRLYILQHITPPEGLETKDYMSENGLDAWKKRIETVVKALHGDGSAKGAKLGEASYFTDSSAYVLGITIDPYLDKNACGLLSGAQYTYSGKYTNTQNGLCGFAAYLYDTAQKTSKSKYKYYTPISVSSNMEMISGMSFCDKNYSYLLSDIAGESCTQYFYSDVRCNRNTITKSPAYAKGEYEGLYTTLNEVSGALSNIVLSGVSFSDVNSVYKKAAKTEGQQGRDIVDALSAVRDAGCLGAEVYDLNDSWAEVSDDMRKFTSSEDTSYLWHNTCDEKQMTGVVAVEEKKPTTPGLVLSDDDLVQAIQMYSDSAYMYITLQMLQELDYSSNAMFVGIDTFQRNDGEYYYAKKFTPNSLSGMEFVLRFDDKRKAELNVIRSYDRSKRNSAFTKESYEAKFNKVADLVYGGFDKHDSQFYQTGSTIYVRIPWTWLNVFDPTRNLMINDKNFGKKAKTTATNGMLVSVMIGERSSGDLMYGFPEKKQDPGYKMFKWKGWEKLTYEIRTKDSYKILSNYYSEN